MMTLNATLYLLGFAAISQALALDLTASPGQIWRQQLFAATGGNSHPRWIRGHCNCKRCFMVYSVTYKDEDSAGNDYTVVVKRDMYGDLLSVSPSLEGEHSGSPVVSDDGNYVFLTHNSPDKTTGYFSILDANLEIVVTRSNAGAFAPPGIYHSPEEGFYDPIPGVADGFLNTNDLIMWSLTPQVPNAPVPSGRIFAFQFARDYEIRDIDTLNYFNTGTDRAFRTITPPVITNKGRSVYWSTSRSEFFGFIGNPGVDRARFNRNPNLRIQFEMNAQWSGQPIFSTPAVSTEADGSAVVFGGSASNEFFRFAHFFNGTDGEASRILIARTPVTTATSTLIVTSPVIDPLARAVYYVESDGTLHQANYDTIEDIWTETIPDGVQGEMAMNADGSILYVMSVEGRIIALGVAEEAPSMSPTTEPVSVPSMSPTAEPSGIPSMSPTAEPSSVPSMSPTAEPSSVPSMSPTAEPSGVPSMSPSAEPSGVPSMSSTAEPSSVPLMRPVAEPTRGGDSIDGTGDSGAFTKPMQLAVISLLYTFLL
ncbi:unnamed protein product [Cylindrotheca closterium]|uniref:Circumsporozoite protein n=1 Tax=Cylindrotheca closterium TaxID=2856 RepID=A0AAD2JPR4_9STRA|nr:unnamed protein product [Cylindrotheca closterium]